MPHSRTIGDQTQGNFKISLPTHTYSYTHRVLIIAIIRLTCGFMAGKHRNSETIYLKVLGKITTWREYPPVIQMRKCVFKPSKLKGCASLALQSQQCCGMLLGQADDSSRNSQKKGGLFSRSLNSDFKVEHVYVYGRERQLVR